MKPVLFAVGFFNGALRELTYKKATGDLLANQISVLTGIIFQGTAIWFLMRKWEFQSGRQACLAVIA